MEEGASQDNPATASPSFMAPVNIFPLVAAEEVTTSAKTSMRDPSVRMWGGGGGRVVKRMVMGRRPGLRQTGAFFVLELLF